jgi:hypothetical protein
MVYVRCGITHNGFKTKISLKRNTDILHRFRKRHLQRATERSIITPCISEVKAIQRKASSTFSSSEKILGMAISNA